MPTSQGHRAARRSAMRPANALNRGLGLHLLRDRQPAPIHSQRVTGGGDQSQSDIIEKVIMLILNEPPRVRGSDAKA